MVSQGAAPIGPELTITAGEDHVIGELAGKPALEKLRETIESLPPEDLRLVQGGLLVGIVVDSNKPDYLQGDFLVRGLVGADPATRPGRGRRRRPPRPGRPPARARRRERRSRPARGAVDPHDGARRPPARGRARVRVQRPRARACSGAPTTTPRPSRTPSPARRRPGSSPPGRSAPSAAGTSCTASRRRWPYSRERGSAPDQGFARSTRRRPGPADGATGGLGQAIARALAARGARSTLTGRRADVLEPLAEETRRARDRGRPLRARRSRAAARGGRRGRRARRERRAARERAADVVLARGARPRARRQPARADAARARAGRAHGRARQRPPRLHLVALRARRSRRAARSTRRRSSACAASPWRCGEDLAPKGVGVSVVLPGFIRDAGMFAESGAKLPPFVGTKRPEDVARAVVKAIENNRAEVEVAPLGAARGRADRQHRAGAGRRAAAADRGREDIRRDRPGAGRQALSAGGYPSPAAPSVRCRASSSWLGLLSWRSSLPSVAAPTTARTSSASRGPSASRQRRRLDADDDLVGVDLLERDRAARRGPASRSGCSSMRLDVARPARRAAGAARRSTAGGLAQRDDGGREHDVVRDHDRVAGPVRRSYRAARATPRRPRPGRPRPPACRRTRSPTLNGRTRDQDQPGDHVARASAEPRDR